MSYYRRAKLAVSIFRSPIRAPSPISSAIRAKFSEFSSFSSLSSRRLGISDSYCYNPFLNGAKRFYHVDRHSVHQPGSQWWIQQPGILFTVVLVGSGVLITLYFGNLETVPYTGRKHFVLLSKESEKKLGEFVLKLRLNLEYKGLILPSSHPDSVRVRKIAKDIIDSLQRGLSHDQIWSDLEFASPKSSLRHENVHDTMAALSEREGDLGMNWSREDEILDDKWVQQSRKESRRESGSQPATSHLEGLNWEVFVIDKPSVNAMCLPGGKIVVSTGLLEHFKSDAEIATILGQKVAHVVARHKAETTTVAFWLFIILPAWILNQATITQATIPRLTRKMEIFMISLFWIALDLSPSFHFRNEREADQIGLLLMASAGYDPRVAPKVYEKLGKFQIGYSLFGYPFWKGKGRAQSLGEAKVMEDALMIYREVRAGHGVEKA